MAPFVPIEPSVKSLGLKLGKRSVGPDVSEAVRKVPNNIINQVGAYTTIITGGTGGIGFETSKHLVMQGGTVVLTARDAAKVGSVINELAHDPVKPNNVLAMAMDLNSLKSVKSFCNEFIEKVANGTIPRLRLVVCNAGYAAIKPPYFSEDNFDSTFSVNYLAHYLMLTLLMQREDIWAPEGGRVVLLSSASHYGGPFATTRIDDEAVMRSKVFYFPEVRKEGEMPNGMFTYANAKVCITMLALHLNGKMIGTSNKQIASFSVQPGIVATNMFKELPISSCLLHMMPCIWKTPDEAASTTLTACFVPDAYAHGQFLQDCKEHSFGSLVSGPKGAKSLKLLMKLSEEAIAPFV